MPDSRYDHLPAVDAITARRRPRPQVEPLHGIGQIPDPGPRAVVLYQHQPDAPQVDPLRVAHHPVAQRPLLGIGNVIAHHTALRLPFRAPEIFGALPLRQRETVPAPVRHRIGIVRKGLHTADIEPEGELPVADLHRPAQIALPDFGVMARYDRFAVYFLAAYAGCESGNRAAHKTRAAALAGRDRYPAGISAFISVRVWDSYSI